MTDSSLIGLITPFNMECY